MICLYIYIHTKLCRSYMESYVFQLHKVMLTSHCRNNNVNTLFFVQRVTMLTLFCATEKHLMSYKFPYKKSMQGTLYPKILNVLCSDQGHISPQNTMKFQ